MFILTVPGSMILNCDVVGSGSSGNLSLNLVVAISNSSTLETCSLRDIHTALSPYDKEDMVIIAVCYAQSKIMENITTQGRISFW